MDTFDKITEASYSLGVDIAKNLQSNGIEGLDVDSFIEGLKDSNSGNELKFDETEMQNVLNDFFRHIHDAKSQENQSAGLEFLNSNGNREEVTVLESGLQYEIITKGEGKSPALTDQVTTHYHGTLIDGTVFDSSVERGTPATFPVNGVIPGWVEALQLMSVGDKWKLYVPAELAYGGQQTGNISPWSTLIFEVELIQVN